VLSWRFFSAVFAPDGWNHRGLLACCSDILDLHFQALSKAEDLYVSVSKVFHVQFRVSSQAIPHRRRFGAGLGQGNQSDQSESAPVSSGPAHRFYFCKSRGKERIHGVSIILGLYALFILRMTYIGNHSPEPEGKYLAYMISGFIAFHVMYNMGMVAALVPITGIPLPSCPTGILSYGMLFQRGLAEQHLRQTLRPI